MRSCADHQNHLRSGRVCFDGEHGWQIAACESAKIELKDDLKDIAPMGPARIGLAARSAGLHLGRPGLYGHAGHFGGGQ
jgi:hypothetical protein